MDGPAYIRIAAELRESIEKGAYQVGQKIPTEENLAIRFGVNRHTLRRAVSLLAAEGMLRVDQGRGTFVADAPVRYPIGERVRFNASLTAQGLKPQYRSLRVMETPASRSVARHLNVEEGEPVAMIERLGLAGGRPLKIATSYFPLRCFPDLIAHLENAASISAVFKQCYGCDHIRQSTVVTARMVRPEDARLLALPLNQPVLVVESVNVDQNRRVIEYGLTRFRGDRTELIFDVKSANP